MEGVCRWYGNGMELIWRWYGDGMEMVWRLYGSSMEEVMSDMERYASGMEMVLRR